MLILASFSYFHRLGVGCGVNMINDHTGWFLSLSGAQLSRVQLLMKHFNEPRLLGRIKVFILSPALSNVKLITMAMKGANKMHHSNWRVEGRAASLQRTKIWRKNILFVRLRRKLRNYSFSKMIYASIFEARKMVIVCSNLRNNEFSLAEHPVQPPSPRKLSKAFGE